jgi:hypothetical protein
MMAGVFAAFTVEAFLNHLGRLKVPDWDARERRLRPGQKLKLLCVTRGWDIELGKRPFQTFRQMLRLRDSLAHGKTETVQSDRVLKRSPRDADSWLEPQWKKLCTVPSARRLVEDAEAIVTDLNRRNGSKRNPFFSPGHARSSVDEV